MRVLVVVSCVSSKLPHAACAAQLYASPLFKKQLAYARTLAPDNRIRILSAKHGLLKLSTIIAPYDVAITAGTVEAVSRKVQLQARVEPMPDIIFALCGRRYRQVLLKAFPHSRHINAIPANLGIGRRMAWLNAQLRKEEV